MLPSHPFPFQPSLQHHPSVPHHSHLPCFFLHPHQQSLPSFAMAVVGNSAIYNDDSRLLYVALICFARIYYLYNYTGHFIPRTLPLLVHTWPIPKAPMLPSHPFPFHPNLQHHPSVPHHSHSPCVFLHPFQQSCPSFSILLVVTLLSSMA